MHNWKWVNLSKMAGFNISLSLNERQSSSDKKHNKSLRLVLFFAFPLLFRRLSTVFFIDSETNETIPLHFWNVFHFFNEKKLFEKNFSPRMCAKRRSATCKKRREFWRKTHTPLRLLIGRIIFRTGEKTSFAILIERIIFFLRVKTIVHSSDWLELICVSKFTTQLFGECLSICIIYI